MFDCSRQRWPLPFCPPNVDMQAVNNLITQEAQMRADIQKALIGVKVQLRQIMGDEIFHKYMRHLRAMLSGIISMVGGEGSVKRE